MAKKKLNKSTILVSKDVHESFTQKRDYAKMSTNDYLVFLMKNININTHVINIVVDHSKYEKLMEASNFLMSRGLVANETMTTTIEYMINNFLNGVDNAISKAGGADYVE